METPQCEVICDLGKRGFGMNGRTEQTNEKQNVNFLN